MILQQFINTFLFKTEFYVIFIKKLAFLQIKINKI